jgi:hypothetical protein
MRRFWHYGLPLGVDLCLAALAWLIVPRLVHTPMATIGLFAPDVFLSIVLITSLGLGWALARTILTFRLPVKEGIVQDVSQSQGVVLLGGGVCYVMDVLAAFLAPGLGAQIHGFLAIPPQLPRSGCSDTCW